jgi:hypothetical protein
MATSKADDQKAESPASVGSTSAVKVKPLLIPFGDELTFRPTTEHLNEEVYRSIPALNRLANAVVLVTNKLSSDARNALYFEKENMDPSLRATKIEAAMIMRDIIENAPPDPEFLSQFKPVPRQSFDTAEKDIWLPK